MAHLTFKLPATVHGQATTIACRFDPSAPYSVLFTFRYLSTHQVLISRDAIRFILDKRLEWGEPRFRMAENDYFFFIYGLGALPEIAFNREPLVQAIEAMDQEVAPGTEAAWLNWDDQMDFAMASMP